MRQYTLGRSCWCVWGCRPLMQAKAYARHTIAATVLAAMMGLLTSCGHGSGEIDARQSDSALLIAGGLQITMDPTLFPSFDPNITDYAVTYKSGSPMQVMVNAPVNTRVSVAGQAARTLTFTTQVTLTPGQSFPLVVSSLAGSKTYYVRCLPSDFPTWTTERSGGSQAEYYVIAPNLSLGTAPQRDYVIIVDSYGVPIWWYKNPTPPIDAKLLPDGNMAWTSVPTGSERRLDGALVRTFAPAGSGGEAFDTHELLLLSNGNYHYIGNVKRSPVDLSPYGGSPTATVLDNVIEEVAPSGTLVWRWSAMDHIPVSETDPHWWPQFLVTASPADPYHMNSVEPNGASYIVSFRHLNAVLQIDKASGNVQWKLGGSPRAESLKFVGDTYGNFGGQHDARVLPDGTLTLHDNGSALVRAPRAVRYTIDPVARTATFVEQDTDLDASGSLCCGNARKLPGGDWVISWGQNPFVTELTASGKRVFRLTFLDQYFSYRVAPVPFGKLTRVALRQGMDAQFPH